MSNFTFDNFKNGIHIERAVYSPVEVSELRNAFYSTLKACEEYRVACNTEEGMENTVHHVLFMNKIFQELLENSRNKKVISQFFEGKSYILNSLGGNNNTKVNYASKIHRDVRFFSRDRMMLNTIWCVSPLNKNTGATQFMPNSHLSESAPNQEEFTENCVTITAEPGDVIYFDSRIWHKAGSPIAGIKERIIFTPIFSRPFIKPGFNYSKACQEYGLSNCSAYIKDIASYTTDIPENHNDWYNFNVRKFYHKEKDL